MMKVKILKYIIIRKKTFKIINNIQTYRKI